MDTKYMDNAPSWSDVRVVEGARLEIWCGARPHLGFESLSLRKNLKSKSLFVIFILSFGEMSEWSKVHDWKSCKVKSLRGFESPSLRFWGQILRCRRHPTPPGPGGSNGQWNAGEPQVICPFFCVNPS